MLNALIFQTKQGDEEAMNQNAIASMIDRLFVPFSKLECVTYIPVEEDNDILDTLENIFKICNYEGMLQHLNYLMSIGDVVVLNDKAYRCHTKRWQELELSSEELKVIKEINDEIKEATNNEENEEEEKLKTEAEAKSIVGVVTDGLKSASEVALSLCDDVAKEAKTIAAMSQQEAENHIKRKFNTNADKFINWIMDKLNIEVERSKKGDSWFTPSNGGTDSKTTTRLKKALDDFKAVKAEGEKKGWKRFKELLKAVFGIIFAVFIEVAKVVLKLAFTLAVGVIKIGACAITTLASCAGIVKDDVVKPTSNAVKKANVERKARKAADQVGVNKILEDDFFEEE
jgi:hypothetical protein